jgi:hypothetical protein
MARNLRVYWWIHLQLLPLHLASAPHKRTSALFFSIALISVAFLCAPLVRAQISIPTPSVPDFTIKVLDTSYDTPTESYTNPYNGQQQSSAGRHVDSRTIEITIKNVPFTPFEVTTSSGVTQTAGFYYLIQWKGHFDNQDGWRGAGGFIPRSNGSETVYTTEGHRFSDEAGYDFTAGGWSVVIPADSQLDFKVSALIGGQWRCPYDVNDQTSNGAQSDWSSTQTISLGATAPFASSDANPDVLHPSVDGGGFGWQQIALVLMAVMIAVLATAVIVLWRKSACNRTCF